MNKTLMGKVALVTGGSRSLGAAIAKRLATDGAVVALTYSASPDKAREVVRAIEATGSKALTVRADAGDAAAVKEAPSLRRCKPSADWTSWSTMRAW